MPVRPPGRRFNSAEVDRYREVVLAGYRQDSERPRRGLQDSEPLVRCASLSALARLDQLDSLTLWHMSDDPDQAVRARVAELAIQLDANLVKRLLVDPNPTVVEAACFACGEIDWSSQGYSEPIGRLSGIATNHPDALCREAAAAALGAIGNPGGLKAVLAACSDRPTVRRRAVLALAAFDSELVEGQLLASLNDKDWQVRQGAEDLLDRRE